MTFLPETDFKRTKTRIKLAETDFYSTVLESGKEFVASEKSVFSLDAID